MILSESDITRQPGLTIQSNLLEDWEPGHAISYFNSLFQISQINLLQFYPYFLQISKRYEATMRDMSGRIDLTNNASH